MFAPCGTVLTGRVVGTDTERREPRLPLLSVSAVRLPRRGRLGVRVRCLERLKAVGTSRRSPSALRWAPSPKGMVEDLGLLTAGALAAAVALIRDRRAPPPRPFHAD